MNGKKRYLAIILFLLIGLTIFAFANPDEEKELEGKDTGTSEKVEDKNDKEDQKEDEDSKLVNSDTDDKESIKDNNKENNNDKVDNTNENARKAVEKAEASLSTVDLVVARTLVALVTDAELREEFTKRLDAVEDAIKATLLVETLENMTYNATDKEGLTAAISYREDKQVQAAISTLTIEGVKADLQARLDAVNKILNDTTAPLVSGVEDGETTNQDVTITVTDDNEVTVKVTLDGQEIENIATFTEEGEYIYSVTDAAFNETVVTFTIDKTAPEFVGISSGSHYASITLDAKDATEVKFTVENKDNGETTELSVGDTLTLDATYYITAIDAAGNTKSVWVAVDNTAPVISGVTADSIVNETKTISISDKFLTTVIVDGVEYTRDDFKVGANNEDFSIEVEIGEEGTHTITATDKVGNTTTVTFVIDKSAPEATSLRVIGGKYYNENGKHVRYATNGTTVYVYTTFAEELAVAPTVTLNGTVTAKSYLAKLDEGSYIYAAKFVISENDGLANGELSVVSEGYEDAAGNVGRVLTNDDKITLNSQKYVVIDKTKATITVAEGTVGTNPYSKLNLKLNDANGITLVEINGTKLPYTGKDVDINDGYEYTFVEGENVVTVIDKAGNKTTKTYVKDITAPEATSLRVIGGKYYNENGKHVRYATNGTTVYVYTTFAEELAVAPTVTLNGTVTAKSYLAKLDEGSYIYAAKFVISENDGLANGELSVVSEGYEDAAGNVGRVLTNDDKITLNSQKYVVIDKTKATITVAEGTVGTNPYSKLNLKLNDANGITLVEINGTKLPYTGKDVDINDGYEYTFVEGENVVTVTDKAGNKTTMTYVKDATAPTIELAGTEGRNNNEYRVEAGTEVSVSDVMATATDNYDNDVEVVITKADFLATKEHPERNVYGYDFSNGFDTTTVGRYNITYKATDDAGNVSTKVMLLVISDTTAPTIILKGTEGRNNNELRVSQDEVVTLDDVTAISSDIVDGEKEIYPSSITRFYPAETGKASHSYDASNGFDTSIPGRYNITYVATDEAGNTTTATMLLVVKVTKTPATVDGEVNLYGNLTLTDEPFYNVNENTEEVVINGNGYSVTQNVTSADKFQWSEGGTRPAMADIFSSANNSKITVNDITFKGTTQSIMLGHYRDGDKAAQSSFTTELNNVNVIGLNVVSFSQKISPGVVVYGKADLNNVNIYGTKLSKLDTDPMWKVYDLAVVNYTTTNIKDSKIGSIYTWGHSIMNIENSEVEQIDTRTFWTNNNQGMITVGSGSTVGHINFITNEHDSYGYSLTVKSGATVKVLDISKITNTDKIVIEEGAIIETVITAFGELTYEEYLESKTIEGQLKLAFKKGGTFKLTEDVTLSEVVSLAEGKALEIDLNDKTLTLDNEDAERLIENEGELLFKNGKIVQKSKGGKGIVDNKGVVKFDNVDVIDYGSYDNSTINNNGGEVVITNSTFEVSATKGVFTENATCASRACANAIVNNDNNGNLTIKDTKLSGNSEYAYAVVSSSGNVNIDNVVINNKRGGLGINGGIITISNTDIDVPSGANSYHGIYIYNTSNTKLTFNSGSVIANRYAMYIANGSTTGTVDVTVNSGTFNTRQPKKYKSITVDSASNLVVKGGTFKNADVTSYLIEGLIQLSTGEVVPVSE